MPATAKTKEKKAGEFTPPTGVHGASTLTAVTVDTLNSQLRDEDGFIGDRARRDAFYEIFDYWHALAAPGLDIIGDTPDERVSKSTLDELLTQGNPREQALMLSAIEGFAQELAYVLRRLLRSKGWRHTQRIAVGGGLKSARFAEIAVARTELLLRAEEKDDTDGIELRVIRHHPDEAGLIGGAHLAPSWMFANYDHILAVDIGGTNIRAGLVRLNLEKADDLSKARIEAMDLWKHGEDDPARDDAVERLVEMLKELIEKAGKEGFNLAPFIGIGCPGTIAGDGSIEDGAQNLPGNWESSRFNLPAMLQQAIPAISGHETTIIMHNDAVVQGLSEAPFMQDVEHWGVVTIGTGLGNARFTNRARPGEQKKAAGKRGKDKKKGGKD